MLLKPLVSATFVWKYQQSNSLDAFFGKTFKTNDVSNTIWGHVVKQTVLATLCLEML